MIDGAATNVSNDKLEVKTSRKQRRHTTGGTKQTVDEIQQAKQLTLDMNGAVVLNEMDQEIDPNSTLGRKQLISMLKQRYGPEMDNFRASGEMSEKVKHFIMRERDF